MPMAPINVNAVLHRIMQRHQAADDQDLERFPDPDAQADELELVVLTLLAAAKTNRRLPRAHREPEVMDRLILLRRVRQLLDEEEARALRDGRAAGAPWVRLGIPLGITTKNGVMQRLQRLRVSTELGPTAPRHPETLRNAAHKRMSEDERLHSWIAQHYQSVRTAAAELIAHREALLTDEGVDEWLDDLTELLEKRETEQRRRSVTSHLRFAVEGVLELAVERDEEPTRTVGGRQALAQAEAVAASYRQR